MRLKATSQRERIRASGVQKVWKVGLHSKLTISGGRKVSSKRH